MVDSDMISVDTLDGGWGIFRGVVYCVPESPKQGPTSRVSNELGLPQSGIGLRNSYNVNSR